MKRDLFATIIAVCLLSSCADSTHKMGIVAHRGYWNCEEAGFSENSIASLRCAQEAGFWGSEMDVQLTADDSLVVFHDAKIGDLVINRNPYDSIAGHILPNGEKIPSLDEYLTQAEKCRTTVLVFEIKEASDSERDIILTKKCIERLKAHNLYDPERVVFISFRKNVCEYLGKNAPESMTEILWKSYDEPQQYLDNNVMGADLWAPEYFNDTTLCQTLKDAGIMTNVWTVDKPEEIKSLALMGVDELTTNTPDKVREIITECGIKERRIKK